MTYANGSIYEGNYYYNSNGNLVSRPQVPVNIIFIINDWLFAA